MGKMGHGKVTRKEKISGKQSGAMNHATMKTSIKCGLDGQVISMDVCRSVHKVTARECAKTGCEVAV